MRFLVTGGSGLLGAELVRQLRSTGAAVTAWSGTTEGDVAGIPLRRIDLGRVDDVAAAFRADRPDIVLHAAAMARLGDCLAHPELAHLVNEVGSGCLAELAATAGARLVLVSTDLVFDGERGNYRETDQPAPLSVYGRTKLAAEAAVQGFPRNVAARVSLLLGVPPRGRPSFFVDQVRSLRQGRQVVLFADEWRTPLAVATAAQGLLALARSDVTGILHLAGPERLTRLELGLRLAKILQADPALIKAARRADLPASEPRPRDVSLDSSLWRSLFPHVPWRAWEEAIDVCSI